MRTNTTEISSIYWNVLLWIFLNESVCTKKESTTRTIRHLLFDFILSRINKQIFKLKYSILLLEQDVSIFTKITRKNIFIGKVTRTVAPTLFFSLSLTFFCYCILLYYCIFSVVYSLLKIKSKANIFENLWNM